jgi:ubiquinol-cytochrome c reductase cytochrome c subunit
MRGRGGSQLALPLLVAAAITGAVVAIGGSPAATPAVTPQPSPGDLTVEQLRGQELYMRDCAWCHGSAGEGSIYGPPIEESGDASVDFMLRTGRMPIEEPETDPPAGPPAYSPDEIEGIVAYTSTFVEGPPIPAVDPASGDLQQGEVLYQENCAACHGSAGEGATLTSGQRASSILESTAIEIAEAIRIGGAGLRTGEMPRFGRGELTDSEVDAIIRYVQFLQEQPPDVGGAGLDHLGPVAEGFIAIFVGLPLLLLLIRWIGKSSREGG